MATLEQELSCRGYTVVAGLLDRAAYIALAETLGEVVAEERIALRPGAHAYVAKPGPVPLHTDHPQVDLIGWLCEEQDDADGASLLLDTRPVVESLAPAQRALLRRVSLWCPRLEGGPPILQWPVLTAEASMDAVFCSPWLRSADPQPEHVAALDEFRQMLSAQARLGVTEVRLAKGEALFIDNRRVLHGRRAIAEASRRQLYRLWLRADRGGRT